MKHLLGVLFTALLCTFAMAQTGGAGSRDQALPPSAEQISNGPVAEYVSDSMCKIGWSTRQPGSMSVQYGPEQGQMTQTAQSVDSHDGKNHHVELTGLKPNTRYLFQVMRNGQSVGGVGTFHTVSAGDPPEKSKALIPQ